MLSMLCLIQYSFKCSGMLPGFVTGRYSFDDCHVDLARLAQFGRARFLHASATGIDPKAWLCKAYAITDLFIGSAHP